MITVFLFIACSITGFSFSMSDQETQEFKDSLNTYEIGTSRKSLPYYHCTINIEPGTGNLTLNNPDNIVQHYLITRNLKDEPADSYTHKISHFVLSPRNTKLLAIEVALNKKSYKWDQKGIWIFDFQEEGGAEYRSFKQLNVKKKPKFFAISDLKMVAFAHDNNMTIYQIAYPKKNLKEQFVYSVEHDLDKRPRQLTSIKFSDNGFYLGEKYCLPDISEGICNWDNTFSSYAITTLPHLIEKQK